MDQSKTNRTWTVAEAKARLSDILRLAEEEGPQRIGKQPSFVIVPAETWMPKLRRAYDSHVSRLADGWLRTCHAESTLNSPVATNLSARSHLSSQKTNERLRPRHERSFGNRQDNP